MLFRLDPARRIWERLVVPPDLHSEAVGYGSLWRSGAGIVLTVAIGREDDPARVYVLERDRWRDAGPTDPRSYDSCVTRDAIYSIQQSGANVLRPALDETTTTVIRRRDRSGGSVVELDPPPVSKRFNGITARLGCDASTAFVTSAEPSGDLPGRLTVHRWAGDRWVVHGRVDLGQVMPRAKVVSGPNGAAFGWVPQGAGPATAVLVVAHADRPLRSVRFPGTFTTFLPVGGTAQVLGVDTIRRGAERPPMQARPLPR